MDIFVKIFDNQSPSNPTTLNDVIDCNFSNGLNGYIDASITLGRPNKGVYQELNFNNHVEIWTTDGVKVWEGRLQSPSGGNSQGMVITAIGYAANLTDFSSQWKPNYPTLTDIATIILSGVNSTNTPQLQVSSSNVPLTGRTITYQPDNYAEVKTHIEEILKYGNTLDNTLMWQVWNDRQFYLTKRPAITAPKYMVTVANIEEPEMGVNADTFYTQVSVRYKTLLQTKVLTMPSASYPRAATTAMQTRYGTTFGSPLTGVTRVPFIREPSIIDITSHGAITDTQASQIASTILSKYSDNGIQLTASRISIKDGDAVTEIATGGRIALSKIHAGEYILISDLAGVNFIGTGFINQSAMLIGEAKYTVNAGGESLELLSENAAAADKVLSDLLAEYPAIPELKN